MCFVIILPVRLGGGAYLGLSIVVCECVNGHLSFDILCVVFTFYHFLCAVDDVFCISFILRTPSKNGMVHLKGISFEN